MTETEAEFEFWKERMFYSHGDSDAWQGHPCPIMGEIVELGEPVLPLIFEEIAKNPDERWFEILGQITGHSITPLPKKAFGNLKEQAKIWMQWGKINGHTRPSNSI